MLMSKKISVFLLLILFNSHAWSKEPARTIAYLENGLQDLNNAERRTGLEILAKELSKGIDVEIITVSFKSMDEAIAAMKDGKVNYFILNSYYYLKELSSLTPLISNSVFAIQRSPSLKENFVLVVNKQLNYKNINSLLGKRVSVHRDYLLEMFYLDYIVKKNTGLALDKFFKNIKDTRTDTQAVLDVFFGESDACLVPQFTLDLVLELNPSVKNKIDLPLRSGADFIPALVLTVPVGSEDITELVRKNLLMLPENARGQEILRLFKIQGITLVKPEALQQMVDIYNEYKKLR